MVRSGLEVMTASDFNLLAGQRVGLLVHPASVDSGLHHGIDLFHSSKGKFDLVSLFGPQHGLYGETQDNMIEWEGFRDPRTGLRVYSLYGENREPAEEMLKDLDTIVIDLQDIGSRYYTFIWTVFFTLKAAATYEKKVVVLDRPNPINGISMEGPILKPVFRSFVGFYPLPPRHGMTLGELACLFNEEIGSILKVVKLENWDRQMWFDETGLPWVMPSPNMPTLETALVYPGICLLEGTNLSEGRGTTRPFEIFGAPWIDPRVFCNEIKKRDLPGVYFRPLQFIPTFNKFKGELCGGAQLHVQDRSTFRPFLSAVAILQVVKILYPEHFQWRDPPYEYEREKLPFDILAGSDELRMAIEGGIPLRDIEASWQKDLISFQSLRKRYLLY